MALWYRRVEPAPPVPIPAHAPAPAAAPGPQHVFRGWTESLSITGTIRAADRLSDELNKRQPILLERPSVVPLGAPRSAGSTPPQLLLDPFDLDFVLGAPLDPARAVERQAKRIHKVRYRVRVIGSSFEADGMLHLFPGVAPEFAIHHPGTLFLAMTGAVVRRERRVVTDRTTDVLLINRYAIRGIRQLDEPLH